MTSYDRVSVIVGVILVGSVLLLVLEVPSRTFEFEPLGTLLTLHITGKWIVSILLLGLSCAGTEAVMRTHPAVRRRIVRYTFPTWILPGLTTLALSVLLPRSPNLLYWLIGLALGGTVLAWLILANYVALDSKERTAAAINGGLRVIAYLLGLVFFADIYQTRVRSLVTATAVTLIASLVSLSIILDHKQPLKRMLLYAGAIGLLVGETTWALNYWRANSLTVGVLLTLFLYVLTGIAYEHTRQELNRQVIFEFLAIAVLGIWIIIRFGPK